MQSVRVLAEGEVKHYFEEFLGRWMACVDVVLKKGEASFPVSRIYLHFVFLTHWRNRRSCLMFGSRYFSVKQNLLKEKIPGA
jgi:hypothetical protein